ncbi:unnamed protein product [Adineta steineri]|uniref:HTH OST-type domain-containing protein n=1 Tax=Adineta steineri TaxID=433720 RepID=A0A819LTB5_9BILA|nr:unnamed protein product [Adineta steineri]CAF3970721.1 unnamed protein product [Adineta steineri]
MTSSLLNEIKMEIRSLLISSQNGLLENELCRDYSLFNSQRSLPYQTFGYLTVTDFLNSLNDILYRSLDGYIHPIVDQSTKHIFKLVQQQRTKKKTTKTKIKQQEYKYIQPSKAIITCNKQKRAVPSIITSSQQMHRADDIIKPSPMVKQMKIMYENKVKKEAQSFVRLKSTIKDTAPKFEQIKLTNDFLRNLLIHFQRQQQ